MQLKNQKQEDAIERVAFWRTLTPTQQLASLDARLGPGVGATRQRAKLSALLNPGVPDPPNGGERGGGLTDTPVKKKKFKKGNK